MDFGQRQMGHEWSHQHGRFALSDKWRRGGHDSFRSRDTETPEEEDGKFANEPLKDPVVVQNLDQRNKEDDGRNHAGQEPVEINH